MVKRPANEQEYEAQQIVRASQIAEGMKQGSLREVLNEHPKLKGRVVYYRVGDPKSERGQAAINFITKTMNYKECTNGEKFVHMPGGKLFWAWHEQHAENLKALKMVGNKVKADLAGQSKRATSDALGYAFQAQEVHTDASVRQINLSELAK